jgi:hypothetical protein
MSKKNHRGISTVIAAVFMVAVIIIGLNVITWGLNLQHNFAQVITDRNIAETEKSSEKIELREVEIENSKFNMTVVNTGALPVKLVNMWVTNMSAINGWHKNYTLTDVINPGNSLTNLGQNIALTAKNSDSYKITLVTERGTGSNFQILSPKDKALKMNLFVVPPTVGIGQNVTVIFSVTNNATDGSIIQSVTPISLQWIPTEASSGGTAPDAQLMEGPTPQNESSLSLGETAFFKWVYKINGENNDRIKFNATITDAKKGNYVMEGTEMAALATTTEVVTQLTSIVGTLTMNFNSFQFCKPSTQDCTSTSSNWTPGWKVSSGNNERYIYRINVTNNDNYDIHLDNNSGILTFLVGTTGGGGAATPVYLKNDSTPTVEDGGAYTPNFSKELAKNSDTTVYFGASAVSSSTLQYLPSSGTYTVNIVLFGYNDIDDNGSHDSTSPYSQNMPFQGLCADACN